MAHMDLGFGAQPGVLMGKLNTAALDEDARKAAVADIKQSIDQAYENGCKLLAMIDGLESWPGEERKQQAIDQVTKSLDELLHICRAAGEGLLSDDLTGDIRPVYREEVAARSDEERRRSPNGCGNSTKTLA